MTPRKGFPDFLNYRQMNLERKQIPAHLLNRFICTQFLKKEKKKKAHWQDRALEAIQIAAKSIMPSPCEIFGDVLIASVCGGLVRVATLKGVTAKGRPG